ncbi:MAG: methyltransferase [Pseudomonadota bacterium]|nr:methyltransferase [Pseudomonadota bacterium]
MTERSLYDLLLYVFLASAFLTFPVLFFVTVPYGRHGRAGAWGPTINATLGWVLMEAPSPLVFFACWWVSPHRGAWPATVFCALWMCHYIHRAFVFPFRRRPGERGMPLLIAGMSLLFNFVNAWLNGRGLFYFSAPLGDAWLLDPRFVAGVALFLGGFALNLHADRVLAMLRKPGDTGYHIPQGGLYRYVSSPNYLGEILEWSGFALATWSLPALAFAVWTAANLVPRARSNHAWYRATFPDYPPLRRALVPFVW